MTDLSPRFALPLLQAGQAQKDIFHNEALNRIDAILHPAVKTLATMTPPAVSGDGESWIVGDGATGAWALHENMIATWSGGGWRFVSPVAGVRVWLEDHRRWAWYDGVAWRDGAFPVAGLSINGVNVVGVRRPAIADPAGGATVDIETRAALSTVLAALREHGLIDT